MNNLFSFRKYRQSEQENAGLRSKNDFVGARNCLQGSGKDFVGATKWIFEVGPTLRRCAELLARVGKGLHRCDKVEFRGRSGISSVRRGEKSELRE